MEQVAVQPRPFGRLDILHGRQACLDDLDTLPRVLDLDEILVHSYMNRVNHTRLISHDYSRPRYLSRSDKRILQ